MPKVKEETITEEKEVEKATKPKKEKGMKKAKKFPFDDYFYMKKKTENVPVAGEVKEQPQIIEVVAVKEEFQNPLSKSQIITAKRFDVDIPQIKEAVKVLNGRKVDGFSVNDIFARYGFFHDKTPMNRGDLAKKYGKSKEEVEIAEEKLKEIISYEDIPKAYYNYTEVLIDNEEKEIKKTLQYG